MDCYIVVLSRLDYKIPSGGVLQHIMLVQLFQKQHKTPIYVKINVFFSSSLQSDQTLSDYKV